MAQNISKTLVRFPGPHSIEVNGRIIALRPDGRLESLGLWTREVAEALAAKEGLTLLSQHWKIIQAMRDYYAAHNVSPVKKLLKKVLKQAGHAALTSDTALDELFPGGALAQGSRIAGVPEPHLDAELDRESGAGRTATTADEGHASSELEFNGEVIALSRTGNLLEPHRWNPALAEFMAGKEGIELTPEHWEVLNFLRAFYFEFGITPMVRILMKHMAEELGAERASRKHLYGLFPKGPSRQGSRIAGLPEPQGCIDD
ncbi:MAG: TusE/DsrC/DsvC family sulfur relay protein [Gammaproteobacteria bacterium]